MNSSTRETKAAAKAHKKQQKSIKKQQQQQQQKGNGPTEQTLMKNQRNSQPIPAKNGNPTTGVGVSVNHNNNNINAENNNNYSSSSSSSDNGSNNVSQKLRAYLEQQQQQKQQLLNNKPILPDGLPKFERSGSFSLKGKLSKLINSITSSKENLTKTEEDGGDLPFKFSRSRSLILPRRSNRRSLIEPQLEQLSEEADASSPASPRKNSVENVEVTPDRPLANPEGGTATITASNTSTPLEAGGPLNKPRKTSTPVLLADPNFDPIANFKKRRSNTLMSSFKSTFAGLTGSEKKKEKLNDKWRASLQSLQAIDNMVSYENMSFIDYDKFNGYEKQLERKLSQISLMDPSLLNHSMMAADVSHIPSSDNSSYIMPSHSPGTPSNVSTPSPFVTPQTVVRRRKTSTSLHGSTRKLAERRSVSRTSFTMDSDYEHNLDKPRNVYRESLDSRKLELLNQMSRNSYILDSDLVDILDLALVSTQRPSYRRGCSHLNTGRDAVDGAVAGGHVQVSLLKILNAGTTNHDPKIVCVLMVAFTISKCCRRKFSQFKIM
ncbi:putative uncharacterized protein DDB_G0271606 isoform X2 [Stomoxys calcitrans]|uniref:putative uncharacterized protein DDB_G0271606 isoform X2 n=1 Tax=Stomoxys calcitrans TaxID=35570 RepID=UPI0027E2587D|nr:putative uncharacterized protein DDB_G0271606 isoform X2 [Stomoxys calcitrans]